ncbi:MAG: radical SAM/SPASM domain-containing protein [Candidatus Cloacimonadales bacterium]
MLREDLYCLKKSFSWRRLGNICQVYSSLGLSNLLKRPIVWGFPPAVMIETTNICNLKCPLCPSGNGTLQRAKGYMEYSTFTKIIDEIKGKSFMVILWNQGEPFLNKEFLKMVKYASEAGLFTLVSTNANLLPQAEEIVKSGLDSMIVSFDGTTQETYNKYRVNGNLEILQANIEKLVAAKKKLGSKTPLIRQQFLVMKHNEHEIEAMKILAKKLQVDQLEFKTAQIYQKSDVAEFLPENPRYRRYKVSANDNFELKFGIKNRCSRLWTKPVINWNGEVAVCCFDKDIKFQVGNILQQPFSRIWKNQAYQKMRRNVLQQREKIEICRNCGEGVKLRIKQIDKK